MTEQYRIQGATFLGTVLLNGKYLSKKKKKKVVELRVEFLSFHLHSLLNHIDLLYLNLVIYLNVKAFLAYFLLPPSVFWIVSQG